MTEQHWWTVIGPSTKHTAAKITFTLIVESREGAKYVKEVCILPLSSHYDASEKTVDDIMWEVLELLKAEGLMVDTLMTGMTHDKEAYLRLRALHSRDFVYFKHDVQLGSTPIRDGCTVFMHPKDAEWGSKRWRQTDVQGKPRQSRNEPDQTEGGTDQLVPKMVNKQRGAKRWRGADPEKFKSLFRGFKRERVSELLESKTT